MAQDDLPNENSNQQLMDALVLLRLRLERVIQTTAPRLVAIMQRADTAVQQRVAAQPVIDNTTRVRIGAFAESVTGAALAEIESLLRGEMTALADASGQGTGQAIERTMGIADSGNVNDFEVLSQSVLDATIADTLATWQRNHIEAYDTALIEAQQSSLDGIQAGEALSATPGPITTTQQWLDTELVTLMGAAVVSGQDQVTRRHTNQIEAWQRIAVLDTRTSIRTNQRVLMADGTEKPLAEVREEDRILTGAGHSRRVKATTQYWTRELMKLRFTNGRTLDCTPDHLIATPGGWSRADSLKMHDAVVSHEFPVVSHEFLSTTLSATVFLSPEPRQVGDLVIDHPDEHSFFASGVVVHNSNECLSNHGFVWTEAWAVRYPPYHNRCRSSVVPIFVDGGQLAVPESGDAWLRTQSAGVQREVLGKSRYDAWRSGALEVAPGTLTDRHGRDYTLAELGI